MDEPRKWARYLPGEEHSRQRAHQCKGPEAGGCLVSSNNSGKAALMDSTRVTTLTPLDCKFHERAASSVSLSPDFRPNTVPGPLSMSHEYLWNGSTHYYSIPSLALQTRTSWTLTLQSEHASYVLTCQTKSFFSCGRFNGHSRCQYLHRSQTAKRGPRLLTEQIRFFVWRGCMGAHTIPQRDKCKIKF